VNVHLGHWSHWCHCWNSIIFFGFQHCNLRQCACLTRHQHLSICRDNQKWQESESFLKTDYLKMVLSAEYIFPGISETHAPLCPSFPSSRPASTSFIRTMSSELTWLGSAAEHSLVRATETSSFVPSQQRDMERDCEISNIVRDVKINQDQSPPVNTESHPRPSENHQPVGKERLSETPAAGMEPAACGRAERV